MKVFIKCVSGSMKINQAKHLQADVSASNSFKNPLKTFNEDQLLKFPGIWQSVPIRFSSKFQCLLSPFSSDFGITGIILNGHDPQSHIMLQCNYAASTII